MREPQFRAMAISSAILSCLARAMAPLPDIPPFPLTGQGLQCFEVTMGFDVLDRHLP